MTTHPHSILLSGAWALALFVAASPSEAGETRTFSAPSYLANPGSFVDVPLTLDNAANLAAVRVQINFMPEVVSLAQVTAGPLGEAFEMSRGDEEGVVQLVFARAEPLAGGSGRLAVLRFMVNPGAEQDMFTEITIADIGLSDSSGVVDLRQKDTVVVSNGLVAVTLEPNIDNARNGLPDWWEHLHGLNIFAGNANLDPENDGMPNLLEYAFGGNPFAMDSEERGCRTGLVADGDSQFFRFSFYRRVSDPSLQIRLQESADLALWNDLNLTQQVIGTPVDAGDGTEFVTVRGTIPVTGIGAGARGFLRLEVKRP